MISAHEMRRKMIERQIGDSSNMEPTALLDKAIGLEDLAKALGPFDPAYTHYLQYSKWFFEAASIRENDLLGKGGEA